jgi:hypothetical protein
MLSDDWKEYFYPPETMGLVRLGMDHDEHDDYPAW